jgi:hypothetical protein
MKWMYYALSLPLVAWLVGCSSSPYVDGYSFAPRPVVAQIPSSQPSMPPPVAAYASIVGIRNEDKDAHLPESVEVRIRIDNNGPQTVTFDPKSLELNTGDLVRFPPPFVQSTAPAVLMPGESVLATANFPFPGNKSYDDFDLATLQLRWGLTLGPQNVEQIADFRQIYQRYYYYEDDPYWGPYRYYGPRGYVGGVVVVRRR